MGKSSSQTLDFLSLVNFPDEAALLHDIEAHFAEKRGFTVATLNLDHIVKLRRDPDFRRAYSAHSHVVADGNPVVWMRRLIRRPVELVPGSELIEPLCALAARTGTPIAFLGSTEETLALTAERLTQRHPGLQVVAKIVPPFGFDPNGPEVETYAAELQRSGAGLCFLALGAPKQEIIASRAGPMVESCGFVSIGAGLDFIAGSQTRAPKWVRAIAMEWFWRMASNPKRLAKRYFDCFVVLGAMVGPAMTARSRTKDEAVDG